MHNERGRGVGVFRGRQRWLCRLGVSLGLGKVGFKGEGKEGVMNEKDHWVKVEKVCQG